MDFANSSFDSFFAPSWSEYCLFSFSRSTVLPPRWQVVNFQGMLRNVDVILVKDFANSPDVLIWQSFLFWIQISYFNGHVYSSLIVEMKSERCQFLKVFFFLKIKFLRSKIQHTLFNAVLWLSCISKTKMTSWKIKMTFFMVLCVSFNLWSWVYLLMVCDEVTFCEFQETKGSSQNLRIHQERLFSFFSTNFISMHNNQ
jgi:hypothetical protein